jgi:hypothetical protein
MPGEFYIEDQKLKSDITEIKNSVTQVTTNITTLVTKSQGGTPVTGSETGDWQTAEADVASIGADGVRNKIHDLTLSVHNLAGTIITIRLYKKVNGVERKCYEQSFDAVADPPGLPIINGTWGIHGVLRVTLQSNDAADNGKAVDYDCMLEAMS